MKLLYLRHVTSVVKIHTVRKIHMDNSGNIVKQKSLKDFIMQRIKATGPLTIAQFMKEVLIHPAFGYYTTRDMFGKSGDFITSPEISQMFGEMIAVWFTNEWYKIGSPKPLNLIELGPGRGSMMSDILRTFNKFNIHNYLTVHMVEVSEILSKIQSEKLCTSVENYNTDSYFYKSGKTKIGVNIYWYKSIQDIKMEQFSFVIAHEFFDALPIHKFQKTKLGWNEVLIDIDSEDKLKYVLSPGPTAMSKILVDDSETREHIEVSPESIIIMEYLANYLEQFGGIALIVDYGHNGNKTDTFRAYKNHQQCDPLTEIGTTDLTADVDFSALRKAASDKLISFGPVTQKKFLEQMHLEVRLEVLLKNCTDDYQRKLLQSSCRTLLDENKMGSAFHFMSFFPTVLKEFLKHYPPVGF